MDHPISPEPTRPPRGPRARRVRRILLGLAVLVVGFLAVIAALPTLLNTGSGRNLIVRVVNSRLEPGRITLDRLALAWTRPIELGGLTLEDPEGKVVVAADRVRTDRGLLGLLRAGGQYGTITVEGAQVDIERHGDGTIDVLEAVATLTKSDPNDKSPSSEPGVAVVVTGKAFRLHSPELAEPITAPAFRGSLTLTPGQPMDAVATLLDGERTATLHIVYDQATESADLQATLDGKAWPIALAQPGIAARGQFHGKLDARRKAGQWSLTSNVELRDAEANGALLAGDRLALGRVGLDGEVAQTTAGWTFRELLLTSGVAGVRASGSIPPTADAPAHLDGNADLAALARMLPHALPLRPGLQIETGRAQFAADFASAGDRETLNVSASLADLAGTDQGRPLALRDPATLVGSATRAGGQVTVEQFAIRAAGIDAKAQGDLKRGVTLDGTIDLAAVETQVRQWLDLGTLDVAGRARLRADFRNKENSYEARLAAEVVGGSIVGLPGTSGPISRDRLRVEATTDGPSDGQGLPTGWHKARLALIAPDARADANATLTGSNLAVAVGVAAPLTSPIASRVEASVGARWPIDQPLPAREIDQLRVVLTPADPAQAAARVVLDVKGRIDLAAGTATLLPTATPDPAAPFGLAAEGITVTGINQPTGWPVARVALSGELGALDRVLTVWTGADSRGLSGHWATATTVQRTPDGVIHFDGGGMVDHLVTGGSVKGPVTLTTKGGYLPKDDYLHLDAADLGTRFGRAVVGGNFAKISGDGRFIDVSGTIEPRWEGIDRLVVAALEPNAQVRAGVRPFHVAGPAPSGSVSQLLRGLNGEVGLDLQSARAFGMTLGAAPVVLHLGGGRAVFDPIRTTLNEGTVDLTMELGLDNPDRLDLRVAPGSKIENAAINEAVSRDVLSYIAPVLNESTQVRGRVSLALDGGATVPLVGDGSPEAGAQTRFDHVVFQPGPFVADLFTMSNLETPKLEMDQTISVKIRDGRVHQSGLAIRAGSVGTVQVDGSVGLDRTLALRAVLPVPAKLVGNDQRVQQIVGDTKITVPVGGTLSHPKLDRRAFEVALRDAAKAAVRRGVRNEINQALDGVIPGGLPKAADGTPAVGNGNLRDTGRNLIEGEAKKLLQGVGRDLLEPRKKP